MTLRKFTDKFDNMMSSDPDLPGSSPITYWDKFAILFLLCSIVAAGFCIKYYFS